MTHSLWAHRSPPPTSPRASVLGTWQPATVAELSDATNIKPGVLYALTRTLVEKGVLSTEKTNGRRAFALAE